MFGVSGNKGFKITFANGNTISVQWGPVNYCDPTHPEGRNAKYDEPMKNDSWEAETVEVAAWDKNGNWHNFGYDQVNGWQNPEQVLEFMNFVANNKLNISNPDDFDGQWGHAQGESEDDEDVGPNFENFASTRGFVTPPNGKSWPDS